MSIPIRRRHLLQALTVAATATAAPGVLAGATPLVGFREVLLKLRGDADVAQQALVLIPSNLDPGRKHPAVLLLHGYPHALKKQKVAIHAWKDSFALLRGYQRLCTPPIEPLYPSARYMGVWRQHELNQTLRAHPFRGMVLVCPFTPNPYFQRRSGPLYRRYGDWIAGELLPAVRAAAPVSMDNRRIGLAGVSMGGLVGIEIFSRQPKLFGAFTAVQAAISRRQAWNYAERLGNVFGQVRPRPVEVVTSTADRYRYANESLHRGLRRRAVPTELQRPSGPHTSAWMREIGTLETLLWQDRVLSA